MSLEMVLLWIRVGFECCDGIRIPNMEKYRLSVWSAVRYLILVCGRKKMEPRERD